jgi:probable phosphoglycerate mutase
MSTTTMYLVRHGETQLNKEGRWQGHLDTGLTDVGDMQALTLMEELFNVHDVKFDYAYSSDLMRAKETCDVMCFVHGMGSETTPELREPSFGPLEGMTTDEIAEMHPHVIDLRFVPDHERLTQSYFPGLESPAMVADRALGFMKQVTAKHKDETVLLVSHSQLIGSVLSRVRGDSFADTRVEHCGWLKLTAKEGEDPVVVETDGLYSRTEKE